MSERKDKIIELGDVFIDLPGGPGTLEEITEVISWSRIGQNNAPCILYNKNGYSNPLKTMYQSMISNGFLTKKDFDKILFSENIKEIYDFIKNYEVPKIRD